ncbi:hypothetical protein Cgig2_032390 [Carnegiea gigantea]|uniref:HAT C-terminal dimerisation domain-containing protein n=1 Tax=Carnegiea gigantea TaxID=171969 RepID=A0A9Q1GRG6_9CARY|nr:hypothetical protein Cgig2_032390 [Carnegiea gigantea]
MASSAFPLSFASPFRLCANSQSSMTFKLPFFYGFLNSALNLKSRRQRHITPSNLYLLNSDSMKKLFPNKSKTFQFKWSSHSSGFHLQVSTSIEAEASEEQEFQVTDVQEISDSEDPIDREDDKHDTQQTPSNKPKVRESDMKPLLQEVIVTRDYKSNNAGGSIQWMCKHCKASFKSSYTRIHYHFFGAPDGKKAGIQRCKELMRDWALHDRIRAKVLHAENEGFALNPRFYDANFLKIPSPGGVERKPPNLDSEVMPCVLEAFRKITESKEEEKLLREQYDVFHQRKRGLFAKLACQEDAVHMDPVDWWSTYGSETPELDEVAKKFLSQPMSSSSAERNWSTYSYIHSVKRNRLNNAKADKLVFIHSNIRLLSRFSKSYTSGPYKYWDIDPESSTMEESITRMQELMWSIDNEEGSNSAKL